MHYSIKETLSKEENLKLAKEYEDKAKSYLEKLNEILKEANREFPGRTFGLTKSKLEKLKSPNEVYDRLLSASRSLYNVQSTYSTRERIQKDKEDNEKQTELLKQRELEKSNLANEAIAYCLENGRTFGDGLSIETAISIANDIAFNIAIKNIESQIGENEYIDFSGQNCEDPCNGWNPKDHRCECGNRRVSWTDGYSSSFKDMTIYAEAY
jgi:hypothetical protein